MRRPGILLRAAFGIAATPALLALASCSDNSQVEFTLHFPSLVAAVTPQEVGYYVFSGDTPGTDCVSLIQAYVKKTALPTPTYSSPRATPCELSSDPGRLTAPATYGPLSVLAFSTRASDAGVTNFLIGCSAHTLTSSEVSEADKGASVFDVYLSLENPDDTPPSATSCTGLTQYCSGGCPSM